MRQQSLIVFYEYRVDLADTVYTDWRLLWKDTFKTIMIQEKHLRVLCILFFYQIVFHGKILIRFTASRCTKKCVVPINFPLCFLIVHERAL